MPRPMRATNALPRAPARRWSRSYLRDLDFAATDPPRAEEPTGTDAAGRRHALLAAGRRQADPRRAGARDLRGPRRRPRAAAADGGGHRAGPHLLAHPRRPPGHGRRRPAARAGPPATGVYGEDVAILAGDALFAEAVRLVCERQEGGPAVQVGVLLRAQPGHRASSGMVGGQFLDLRGAGHESAGALRRVHALKTGRLIACAVHCALVLARAAAGGRDRSARFARELGLLFQIVDDILDVDGLRARRWARPSARTRARARPPT